ncbi:YceI family protein [Methylocapsa sp. S129]|uniref:YceI family protein n=1 Tax=Methylocapsa sp. S129 TaxID=1641869 RepID=UPI00131BF717|nr:YceI family protein [Methylocapsa sp. S129]
MFLPFAPKIYRHPAIVALALTALTIGQAGDAAARSNWAIDPARTRISFSIDAVGYPKTEGEFHQFDGRISVDFDHPGQSRVSFHVEAQSIDVGSASFSDYLRSAAFLNAARFKEIVFTSTAVEKIDEHEIRVTGDLTMLGVTMPLTVDVAVSRQTGQSRARLGFTAHAKIDRLAFGMNSGFPVISRDVDLLVASEAIEQ